MERIRKGQITQSFHENELVFSKSIRRNILESIRWEMT